MLGDDDDGPAYPLCRQQQPFEPCLGRLLLFGHHVEYAAKQLEHPAQRRPRRPATQHHAKTHAEADTAGPDTTDPPAAATQAAVDSVEIKPVRTGAHERADPGASRSARWLGE